MLAVKDSGAVKARLLWLHRKGICVPVGRIRGRRALTFMSIRDVVSTWLADPASDWSWHYPAMPSGEMKRYMLVSKQLRSAMLGPWKNAEQEKRLAQLRGDLDAFVLGQRISVANHPYEKDKTAYIARVDPVHKEIWDIRSIDPKPGIRVLGCFAEVNVFVALVWDYRANLDGPGGPLWGAFVQQAEHMWNRFSLGLSPHSGSAIGDYISDNFFSV